MFETLSRFANAHNEKLKHKSGACDGDDEDDKVMMDMDADGY
jgi:hypothetical protein